MEFFICNERTLYIHLRPKEHDKSSPLFVVHVLHLTDPVGTRIYVGATWSQTAINQSAKWEATFFSFSRYGFVVFLFLNCLNRHLSFIQHGNGSLMSPLKCSPRRHNRHSRWRMEMNTLYSSRHALNITADLMLHPPILRNKEN